MTLLMHRQSCLRLRAFATNSASVSLCSVHSAGLRTQRTLNELPRQCNGKCVIEVLHVLRFSKFCLNTSYILPGIFSIRCHQFTDNCGHKGTYWKIFYFRFCSTGCMVGCMIRIVGQLRMLSVDIRHGAMEHTPSCRVLWSRCFQQKPDSTWIVGIVPESYSFYAGTTCALPYLRSTQRCGTVCLLFTRFPMRPIEIACWVAKLARQPAESQKQDRPALQRGRSSM